MVSFDRCLAVALVSLAVAPLTGCGGSSTRTDTTGPSIANLHARAAVVQKRNQRLQERIRALKSRTVAPDPTQADGGGGNGSAGTPSGTTPPRTTGSGELSTADRTDFSRLAASLGGQIGLTISPVGLDQRVTELGSLTSGVAWSTIKVPIALAVTQRAGGRLSGSVASLMQRAITESDNGAAEGLWAALGRPATAGTAVQKVLASAGDSSTTVQTSVTRPGFTSFGQTEWPLASQQRFVAALPCLALSDQVVQLMGQVVAGQSWGLGSSGLHAAFKGGWGPDPSGHYLVRQMGLLQLRRGGTVAVTIASIPADGSFGTGTANLTKMAAWLARRLADARAPRERC